MPLMLGTKKYGIPFAEAYVGTRCVLRKVAEQIIEFTSDIIPVFNKSYVTTMSNEYGEWTVTASSSGTTNNGPELAFDRSSGTLWNSKDISASGTAWLCVDCPVKISPTKIFLEYACIGSSSNNGKIQGFNPDTGVYEDLVEVTRDYDWLSSTYTIDTDKYYTKFRVLCYRYSSSYTYAKIRRFEIKTGTAKI